MLDDEVFHLKNLNIFVYQGYLNFNTTVAVKFI